MRVDDGVALTNSVSYIYGHWDAVDISVDIASLVGRNNVLRANRWRRHYALLTYYSASNDWLLILGFNNFLHILMLAIVERWKIEQF